MNLAQVKAWLKTHRKQAALGAAGVGVAALALYRRRAAASAQGLTVGYQAQETDAAGGAYDQFTTALSTLSQQQQDQSGAIYDALGQIAQGLSAGQSSIYDAMAQNAAAQNQATGGLFDQISATIAALGQPAVAAAPRSSTGAPNQGVYTFQQGDKIGDVAAKYGVTVDQLLVANPTSGAGFADPGHRVTVPVATAPSSGPKPDVRYEFKAGESYASVAKQFGLTEAQLRAMNPLAGSGSGKPGTAITIRG